MNTEQLKDSFPWLPRWWHDPRAQRCCWWPRRQSPASSGDARCGDLAVTVSLNERAQPHEEVGGALMLSSKVLKLLSSCSDLLCCSNINTNHRARKILSKFVCHVNYVF